MHIPSSGVFITFEGGEGSGKSLQSRLLCDKLRASFPKLPVVLSREPGGSEGAERIRQLLTTGAQDRWLPFSEFLLFTPQGMITGFAFFCLFYKKVESFSVIVFSIRPGFTKDSAVDYLLSFLMSCTP